MLNLFVYAFCCCFFFFNWAIEQQYVNQILRRNCRSKLKNIRANGLFFQAKHRFEPRLIFEIE